MDVEAEFDGTNMNLNKEQQEEIENEEGQKEQDDMENEIFSVEEDIDPEVWKGDDDFSMDEEENDEE